MFHRKGLQIMEPSSGNKDIVDYGGMVDILYLHGFGCRDPANSHFIEKQGTNQKQRYRLHAPSYHP